MKGEGKTLKDLKGMKVYLPELSVSHYLLVRGLEKAGLAEKDVTVVNTSMRISSRLLAPRSVQAAVAWNPQLSVIKSTPQTTEVFSSSQVPGELIDMMVVNTQTLKDNPALGKALTGAWYEMMGQMKAQDTKALNAMAADSGTDLAGYQAQLKTTHLFWTPPTTWRLSPRRIWRKPCSAWRSSPLIKGCWVRRAECRFYRHEPSRATSPAMPPT
jgi:NitT/TauT family transport system substrate-binding protein